MRMVSLIGLITALVLVGCAHTTMRGSVAMKVADDEAHVCLGDNEVKVGDKVSLFKNVCTGSSSRAAQNRTCNKVSLGEGEVTRLLNEHYSVIKVSSGVPFEEGTIVERN